MITIESSGSFKGTTSFLDGIINGSPYSGLDALAQEGVNILSANTPEESGLTASSWGYEIVNDSNGVEIWWYNTNVQEGFNVAVGLQYGHATGTGGYISGQDYINPGMKPLFDKLVEKVWEEVRSG